ncbi:MucBP domain-containing protein [Gemella sp. GH3]|uniref:MucBP domain-containing protein n=1 Tax=unclassified Gemella TaxID=2624949 RepID=UPI0015CFFCFA|nr:MULTISPECIES: MucBP domain-containing protein [unclassified Gemella]MBF0714108.1 MucBP domain-containing protein [Gemella sp. GH3.1]NYS51060.1 MucBP domain-containing protein [Gemella sp. GH3]
MTKTIEKYSIKKLTVGVLSLGIGMFVLPALSGEAHAADTPQNISSEVKPANEQQAKEVANESTATITPKLNDKGNLNYQVNKFSYEVTTKLTEPAKAGNYVEYRFENLPTLPNKLQVKSGNTVIGNVKVLEDTNAIKRANDNVQEEKFEGNHSKVRVIFNKAVEELENIVYKFSLDNAQMQTPNTIEDKNLTSKITQGNNTLAEVTKLVEKGEVKNFPKTEAAMSYNTVNVKDNEFVNPELRLVLTNSSNTPAKKDDLFTYTLSDNTGISFDVEKIKELYSGKTITTRDHSHMYADSTANKYGVVTLERYVDELELVEVTPKSIKLKVKKDFETVDRGKTINQYFPYLITDNSSNTIDAKNKKILLPNMKLEYNSANGNVNNVKVENHSIDIQGVNVNASGIKVPKASVIVKYVDELGKEISNTETILKQEKYGTSYEVKPKNIENYTYKELGKNSAGLKGIVLKEDQTIVLVYTKKEEPKEEPKVEIPKVEPKEEPKVEIPKVEPKEEPKAEKPKVKEKTKQLPKTSAVKETPKEENQNLVGYILSLLMVVFVGVIGIFKKKNS